MSDATKPVACGACGGEASPMVRQVVQPAGYTYTYEHRFACMCGSSSAWKSSLSLAVAAWNAMWAGRAGEATKALIADLDSQRTALDGGEWFFAHVQFDDLDAALAELGIAPSPDGGEGVGP